MDINKKNNLIGNICDQERVVLTNFVIYASLMSHDSNYSRGF